MYFVVMPRVNPIVILMTYACYLYSINCPTVICLPNMLLFILWRDTTSELWTLVQFPLYCYTVYFARTVYFLAYYYCFPLDMLIPLFTANRWDWQPHRKLGAKFLVVLCVGSTLLLVQSKALDEAPYKLFRAVVKLAGITFWNLAFSYWFDKPGFLLRKNLLLCSSHLLLGFPTGRSSTSTPHRIKDKLFWSCWGRDDDRGYDLGGWISPLTCIAVVKQGRT
jgi:hypothetical protein